MRRYSKIIGLLLCMALLLSGCNLRTVDQLYCLPMRSDSEQDLQEVISRAMSDLEYSAPTYGENRQVTQKVDLDGDGIEECVVFARDESEKPLKILIFCQLASGWVLMDTIEGYGFAFDFVYYTQVDGQPGQEIVVGLQVSNEVLRSVAVYRFSSGFSRQLMSGSCARVIAYDFDGDGVSSLLLLSSGTGEDGHGTMNLYEMVEDRLEKTAAAPLSQEIQSIRRTQVASLADGGPALYVTGLTQDGATQTEVFTVGRESIQSVWLSEPVQNFGGQNLFPMDLDGDACPELPSLVPMAAHSGQQRQQYFVSWHSLDSSGQRQNGRNTFMHLTQGWYLSLEDGWLKGLSVVTERDSCIFYMQSGNKSEGKKIMTVYALTDEEAMDSAKDYTVLYESDTVIYAAALEPGAAAYGFTEYTVKQAFHMIRTELNTEEN